MDTHLDESDFWLKRQCALYRCVIRGAPRLDSRVDGGPSLLPDPAEPGSATARLRALRAAPAGERRRGRAATRGPRRATSSSTSTAAAAGSRATRSRALRRVYSCESTALTRLLAEVVLRPPDLRHFDAGLSHARDTSARRRRAQPRASSRCSPRRCPTCGRPVVVEEYIWEVGARQRRRARSSAARSAASRHAPASRASRRSTRHDISRARARLGRDRPRRLAPDPAPRGSPMPSDPKRRAPLPDELLDAVHAAHASSRSTRSSPGSTAICKAPSRSTPGMRLGLVHALLPMSRLNGYPGRVAALRIRHGHVQQPSLAGVARTKSVARLRGGLPRGARLHLPRRAGRRHVPAATGRGHGVADRRHGQCRAAHRSGVMARGNEPQFSSRRPVLPGRLDPRSRVRLVLTQPPVRWTVENASFAYLATSLVLGRQAAAEPAARVDLRRTATQRPRPRGDRAAALAHGRAAGPRARRERRRRPRSRRRDRARRRRPRGSRCRLPAQLGAARRVGQPDQRRARVQPRPVRRRRATGMPSWPRCRPPTRTSRSRSPTSRRPSPRSRSACSRRAASRPAPSGCWARCSSGSTAWATCAVSSPPRRSARRRRRPTDRTPRAARPPTSGDLTPTTPTRSRTTATVTTEPAAGAGRRRPEPDDDEPTACARLGARLGVGHRPRPPADGDRHGRAAPTGPPAPDRDRARALVAAQRDRTSPRPGRRCRIGWNGPSSACCRASRGHRRERPSSSASRACSAATTRPIRSWSARSSTATATRRRSRSSFGRRTS